MTQQSNRLDLSTKLKGKFFRSIISLYIYKVICFNIIFFWGFTAFADPIKMGYFNLPPHHYIANGNSKPTGVAIHYFEALASEMGETVEWIGPFPLLRLSEKLRSGQIEGSIGFPKLPQFEQYLFFTSTPMFIAKPVLIVHKENSLKKITSASNLKGWRIGTITPISGLFTPLIDNHLDFFSLEKIGGDNWFALNIRKLLTKRLDAIFDRNQFTIPFVAATMNSYSEIRTLYIPDPPTAIHMVFLKKSKRGRGRTLTEKCDAVLPLLNFNYEQMAQKEIDALVFQQR